MAGHSHGWMSVRGGFSIGIWVWKCGLFNIQVGVTHTQYDMHASCLHAVALGRLPLEASANCTYM